MEPLDKLLSIFRRKEPIRQMESDKEKLDNVVYGIPRTKLTPEILREIIKTYKEVIPGNWIKDLEPRPEHLDASMRSSTQSIVNREDFAPRYGSEFTRHSKLIIHATNSQLGKGNDILHVFFKANTESEDFPKEVDDRKSMELKIDDVSRQFETKVSDYFWSLGFAVPIYETSTHWLSGR